MGLSISGEAADHLLTVLRSCHPSWGISKGSFPFGRVCVDWFIDRDSLTQVHQLNMWRQILTAIGYPVDPATGQQPDTRVQQLAQVRFSISFA